MKQLLKSIQIIFVSLSMIMTAQENINRSEMNKTITTHLKVEHKYLFKYPKNTQSGQMLPLIVFLHGSGERGDNVDLVRVHGPWYYAEHYSDFPFMILAPQCQEGETWEPVKLDLLLDEIIACHPVDTNRIYLTGLSRGGFGTWD
jgi:predicted peptidase